jgi:hypothetical protein
MSLGDKQKKFTRLISNLLDFIHARGYEITFGDAFRDPRIHGHIGKKKAYGHRNSCHKIRLALDLNLFKDGVYLTTDKDHEPFGLYWESLDPDCRWGGRFNDGNHYSLEHNGSK